MFEKPLGLLDSLNYDISQMSGGMNVSYCMWLDIYRNNKLSQPYQVVVGRHA